MADTMGQMRLFYCMWSKVDAEGGGLSTNGDTMSMASQYEQIESDRGS